MPSANPLETIIVLLNFENYDVEIDLELGIPGKWARLADIDFVNDLAPEGSYDPASPITIVTPNGRFPGFTIQDSSGFIYKWIGS